MDHQIFKLVSFKLLKTYNFKHIDIFIFEFFNDIFWSSLFEFEYGLPMRSTFILSYLITLDIFFTQYIKSIQLSKKLLYGGALYSTLTVSIQFISIVYIANNYSKGDRMLVTAYLFSIAIGASVKLIYYIKIVDFKLFKLSKNKSSEFKLFEKYAMPSAMLALLAVITTHGMKLLVQKNISLQSLVNILST